MKNTIYNKEVYKSSLMELSPLELIQTHSAIRVSMAKTPIEKRMTKKHCEILQQITINDTIVEMLEKHRIRKDLLSMLNVTNGVLLKLAYKITGRTNWARLHKYTKQLNN